MEDKHEPILRTISIVVQIRWKLVQCNSMVRYHMVTDFSKCHDSTAVVPYAKTHSDHFSTTWMRAEEISIEFELRWKKIVRVMGSWAYIHNANRCLTARSREVSKPRYSGFNFSNRSEILQARRQQRCRDACEISLWHSDSWVRDFTKFDGKASYRLVNEGHCHPRWRISNRCISKYCEMIANAKLFNGQVRLGGSVRNYFSVRTILNSTGCCKLPR